MRSRRVLALVELQELDDEADYQDAAVELILEKPMCGPADDDDEIPGLGEEEEEEEEESHITICHYPPGSRDNPQTITIGVSAWPAHKMLGDRIGACEDDVDGDGVPNSADLCPNTYMPESVPQDHMLFGRYALTEESDIFRKGPRKKVSEYTLADTKGCSCEQLIDVAESRKSYHFSQFPRLRRNIRSLFPFYTSGARNHGCSNRILRMVQRG